MYRYILAALVATTSISAYAQQVNTLYFLENSPMRHTINPAFQPVSQGYVNFTPLGWTSMSVGNNSLTVSDLFFVDPTTHKTITPLHPNADRNAFLRTMRNVTYFNGGATFGIVNFGFRHKDNGYVTIGINQRIEGIHIRFLFRRRNAEYNRRKYNQPDGVRLSRYDLHGDWRRL